jgi:DNA invertase Pin-like site-specific DNA recombinase
MNDSTTADPLRAAVYCRISEDQDDERLGVERQGKDCLKRVDGEGWIRLPDHSLATFSDNDVSGDTRATERAAFGRLCAAIQAGKVDVVVAYKQARLFRHTAKYLAFCELCRAAGVKTLAFVSDPDVDLGA